MKMALKRVPIDSVCTRISTGGTPLRANSRFWDDGIIPWFKTGELKDWYLENAEERITEEGFTNSAAKYFPPNTVLMAMYGDGRTITSLGILRNEATTNQACCAMVADPQKCHFLYLFYALKYHRHELLQLVVAGAQRNLSTGIIRNFRITSHPLPVQQRILETLSAYDDLIENNRRRIALLEKAARLLYEEWFVRLRFPGHEHTRIANGTPHGWERKPLNAICPDLREAANPADLDASTPYIGLEHMPRRSITLNEWGRADEVTSTKLRFKSGDILFGKIRPYFHKVGFALTDGVASSDAIVLRPVAECFHGFALLTVSSDWFVTVVSKTAKEGSKMPRADWNLMEQHQILVPPHSILLALQETVVPILEQLRTLSFTNQKLRAARDLLLPRLMSGAIAV
jgi:type I restriction enzyme S subunit